MSRPIYIGFAGAIGSGKTWFADRIAERLKDAGVRTRRTAFAVPVKDLAVQIFQDSEFRSEDQDVKARSMGYTWEEIRQGLKMQTRLVQAPFLAMIAWSDTKRFRGPVSRRDILVGIGHYLGRGAHSELWLTEMLRREAPGYKVVLIDGLRYRNEFDFCDASGGWNYYITALAAEEEKSCPSEQAWQMRGRCIRILNSGPMTETIQTEVERICDAVQAQD